MWPYIISAAFVISAFINIFLVWYCVKVLRELFSVSETLEDLFVDVETFKRHLEGVYELEMFYGDQTLENLLSHARALSKEFDRYEILFSLKEPLEDDDFDKEDDTDST
jgi:hypothetical protein